MLVVCKGIRKILSNRLFSFVDQVQDNVVREQSNIKMCWRNNDGVVSIAVFANHRWIRRVTKNGFSFVMSDVRNSRFQFRQNAARAGS